MLAKIRSWEQAQASNASSRLRLFHESTWYSFSKNRRVKPLSTTGRVHKNCMASKKEPFSPHKQIHLTLWFLIIGKVNIHTCFVQQFRVTYSCVSMDTVPWVLQACFSSSHTKMDWCWRGVSMCCIFRSPPPWDSLEALHANPLELGMSLIERFEYVSHREWLGFDLIAFFNASMSHLSAHFIAALKSKNTRANSRTGYVSVNNMDHPLVALAKDVLFFATRGIQTNRKKKKEIFFWSLRQNTKRVYLIFISFWEWFSKKNKEIFGGSPTGKIIF